MTFVLPQVPEEPDMGASQLLLNDPAIHVDDKVSSGAVAKAARKR